MISILIFLVSLLTSVYILLSTKDSAFTIKEGTYHDEKIFNFRWLFKPLFVLGMGLLISIIQPFSLERVDAGHKGLKINLTGTERGVSSYQYKTGWVIYNSWVEQMLEFPTFQQHIEYDEQEVITKGGFSATIKPSFNYSLKEESIGDMFVNLRLPTKQVEQGWLKNAIVSSVNDVANRWEVDAIFNKREEFEASIIAECNKRVSKWFTVSQLRTNIVPPKALQEAIESKTKAIQQAQAEDQKAKTAEAEARKKVAIAKGDSAQMVIQANAEALSIKIRQREITPEYVEYLKAQKWNGVLPTTMTGTSGTFLNIK